MFPYFKVSTINIKPMPFIIKLFEKNTIKSIPITANAKIENINVAAIIKGKAARSANIPDKKSCFNLLALFVFKFFKSLLIQPPHNSNNKIILQLNSNYLKIDLNSY